MGKPFTYETMEDIEDDYYWEFYNQAGEKIIPGFTTDTKAVDSIKIEPGYLPRPSDQRISFNIFFQDYLPNNPTYKMHLNLVFGTGLPFGAPKSPRYQHIYRTPSYRRVRYWFFKLLKKRSFGCTRIPSAFQINLDYCRSVQSFAVQQYSFLFMDFRRQWQKIRHT